MSPQGIPAAATDFGSSSQKSRFDQTSVSRGLIGRLGSIFKVFPAGCPAWIAREETKHEDAEEKEDDRVNGDLEGEHGDRPASVTGIILWGMTASAGG